MDKINFGNDSCKVFVGAIPHDAEHGQLKEEFAKWGSVVQHYYKGPPCGWATVEFTSSRKRDEFIKEKQKHKILNKVVDVKKYTRPSKGDTPVPVAMPRATPRHSLANATAATQQARPVGMTFAGSVSAKKSADISSTGDLANGVQTGVITSYIRDDFGTLRTSNSQNGFFHRDSVFFCSSHLRMCNEVGCPNYRRCSDVPKQNLSSLLPIGSQVNLLTFPIELASFVYSFEASLVWSQLSKRPAATPLSEIELSDRLINFIDCNHSASVPSSCSSPVPFTGLSSSCVLPPFNNGSSRSLLLQEEDTLSATSSNQSHSAKSSNGIGAVSAAVNGISTRTPTVIAPDLDDYIDGIDKLRTFFSEQFKFDGRDPKELGVGSLATRIMECLGGQKAEAEVNGVKAIFLIHSFMKNNGIVADKSKMANIISHYKVLHHSLAYQTRNSSIDSANRPLARIVQQLNLIKMPSAESVATNKSQDSITKPISTPEDASNSEKPPAENCIKLLEDYVNVDEDEDNHDTSFDEELDNLVSHKPTTTRNSRSTPENWSELFQSEESEQGSNIASASEDYGRIIVDVDDGEEPCRKTSIFSYNSIEMTAVRSFMPINDDQCFVNKIKLEKTDVDKYHHLANWIEEVYTREAKEISVFSFSPALLAKTVTISWKEHSKPPVNLKEDVRKLWDRPSYLLKHWIILMKKSWQSKTPDYPTIALDVMVKATFLYGWNAIKPNFNSERKFDDFSRLLLAIPFGTESCMYNLKGVVTHFFSDYVGVIQTEEGKVLFDRNIVCVHDCRNGDLGNWSELVWSKCKSERQILPGSLVKLNVLKSRVKGTKKTKLEYLFATKVWLAAFGAEPFTGAIVPGGQKYWAEVTNTFETIVKNNQGSLAAPAGLSMGTKAQTEEYEEAFAFAIREHFKPLRCGRPGADFRATNSSFSTFLQHCLNSEMSFNKLEKIKGTLKILERCGVTFFDLRKDFVAKTLMEAPELFKENLENILITANPQLLDREECNMVTNIVPLIETYFRQHDKVAEGQLQENQKVLRRHPDKSLAHLTDVFNTISQLLSPLQDSLEGRPSPSTQSSEPVVTKEDSVEDVEETVDDVTPPPTEHVPLELMIELQRRVDELEAWKTRQTEEQLMLKTQLQELSESLGVFRQESRRSPTSSLPKAGNSGRQIVKICSEIASGDTYEIPTNEHGDLSFSSVKAIFGGVNALKYKLDGAIRICNQIGEIFDSPEGGWGNRLYMANIPGSAATSAAAVNNAAFASAMNFLANPAAMAVQGSPLFAANQFRNPMYQNHYPMARPNLPQ